MNKKLYLALLLFFPSLIFAQGNYQPGVIVNIKGDTIHGFINYKEWGQNPDSIEFKTQLKSKPRQLGAKDIQYFGVDGYEYYRRYTVNITLNGLELDQLTSIADTSTKTATVFLKILENGKNVTLFSYTDDLKERFYVSDKANKQPAELVFLRYLNADEGGVVNRKYYQGQLGVIAENNHLNLTGLVSNSNYDEISISKVIDKINGAKSSLPVQNKQSSVRFFTGLAAGNSTLQFTGGGTNAIISGSSTSFTPQFAIGIDGYLNPNVRKLILRVELSISTQNFSLSSAQPGVSVDITQITSQQLKQYDIGLTPMVIYNFYNSPDFKVYAGAGIKLNFSLYPTNVYTVASDDQGKITPESTSGEGQANGKLSAQSIYPTIPIKAGVFISQHIDIYAAYYALGYLTDYVLTRGSETCYQVGLDYMFGK